MIGTPNKTRVAAVGAGYFSQFHLEGWLQQPDAHICAICDQDEAKAQALARRFGVAQTYADFAAMLDAEQPDLVDVITQPPAHAALVGAALHRRIPVVCQKPFTGNYAAALALTERAEAVEVPLIVHENFRFAPWYREAFRLIQTGVLGDLHGLSFRLRPGDGQGPNAYIDRQPYFQRMQRLLIAETAIHLIDTFRYLAGEVQTVYAQLRHLNPAIAGEDAAILVFGFASGAAGVFDGNRLNEHPAQNLRRTMGELWVEGSRGVLRLDGEARLWFKPHGLPEHEHLYHSGNPASFGGGACGTLQRHVLDGLKHRQPIQNRARDYLQNLRVQEAAYHSNETGKRVELKTFQPAQTTSDAISKQKETL